MDGIVAPANHVATPHPAWGEESPDTQSRHYVGTKVAGNARREKSQRCEQRRFCSKEQNRPPKLYAEEDERSYKAVRLRQGFGGSPPKATMKRLNPYPGARPYSNFVCEYASEYKIEQVLKIVTSLCFGQFWQSAA